MEVQLFGVLGKFAHPNLKTYNGALFDWSSVSSSRKWPTNHYDVARSIRYRFLVSDGEHIEHSPMFEHTFERTMMILTWSGNGIVLIGASLRWYPYDRVWPESKLLRDAHDLGLPQFVG